MEDTTVMVIMMTSELMGGPGDKYLPHHHQQHLQTWLEVSNFCKLLSIVSSSVRILHSLEEGFSAPQWGDETEWSHQKIISEHKWSQWSGASSSSVLFLFLWKVSHSS